MWGPGGCQEPPVVAAMNAPRGCAGPGARRGGSLQIGSAALQSVAGYGPRSAVLPCRRSDRSLSLTLSLSGPCECGVVAISAPSLARTACTDARTRVSGSLHGVAQRRILRGRGWRQKKAQNVGRKLVGASAILDCNSRCVLLRVSRLPCRFLPFASLP